MTDKVLLLVILGAISALLVVALLTALGLAARVLLQGLMAFLRQLYGEEETDLRPLRARPHSPRHR